MGLNPWYVGQTVPSIKINLNTDGGADNIAGVSPSNLTMIIRNVGVTPNTDQNGAGTFQIDATSPAVVEYFPASADVASAGNFTLIVKAAWPTGGTKVYDPISWTITQI